MKRFRFVFLFVPVVLMASSCLFTPKVESCFTYAANANEVTFSSGCSENGESYQWDFGDGSTSLQENPTHTYATAGNFNVVLNVTGKKGKVESTSQIVTVVGCVPACVNGNCVSGACDCNQGYEGDACDVAINEKFAGTYNASELCTSGSWSYTVTITASSTSPSQIYLTNLYGDPSSILANIQSDGRTFVISPVNLGNYTLQSSGSHGLLNSSATTVNLSFLVSNSFDTDVCTVTMVRQ